MDEENSIIYGLEHQARAMCPQYGEGEAIRFVIGTQSPASDTNRVHVIELEEDTGALHNKVFKHSIGEVWQLRCSPHDAAILTTVHSEYDASAVQCTMGVTVFRLPTTEVIMKDLDLSALQARHAEDLEELITFRPEKAEEEIRCAEWQPIDKSRVAVVSESAIREYDLETGECVTCTTPYGRAHVKFTAGKWCPHRTQSQFAALQDTHIKCYDLRAPTAPAWSIDNAHAQLVRDIDFNPNRQFHVASVGDDGALKIWDYRSTKEPIFARYDHSHWVWTVRYNTFHEQLILTGSSDARALLTAAVSICEDPQEDQPKEERDKLQDGPLQCHCRHEDSVYCCEWSAAEPWSFASLSYDGRLVLCRVPSRTKYKLLL